MPTKTPINHLLKIHEEVLPRLKPVTHPWITAFIKKKEDIMELMGAYGSPVHVHHTAPFEHNKRAYSDVLNKFQLEHLILFARKANKCRNLVKAAKNCHIGVDTASVRELQDCLEEGIPTDKIIVTAAIKTEKLMRLAVANGVKIILDNHDEVALLEKVCNEAAKTTEIGLRIGSFIFQGQPLPTRFGFTVKETCRLITQKIHSPGTGSRLRFKGFHFHLNGYSIEQRAEALKQTLELSDKLSEKGISTEFIDMGGGFPVNYLESKEEWEKFHVELKKAVKGKREPITYQNDSLNIFCNNSGTGNKPKVYPYYNDIVKEKFLEKILLFPYSKHELLYQALRFRNIEIRMEPGRSLLDQVGVTLARVCFRKHVGDKLFVGLEMNRTQMCSSSPDFLLDPVYIAMKPPENPEPHTGYLVGAYCLEQELILKRKISFPQYPSVGDVLCFVNTAGYMMHFYESRAHLFDLAKNIFTDSISGKWQYDADPY